MRVYDTSSLLRALQVCVALVLLLRADGATVKPTFKPSFKPSPVPTTRPTKLPTLYPTSRPTGKPTSRPTSRPTSHPTTHPTVLHALHGDHEGDKPSTAMVAGVVIGVIAGVGIAVGAYMNRKTKAAERAASAGGGVHKIADHDGETDTYNPMGAGGDGAYLAVDVTSTEESAKPSPVTPPALRNARRALRRSVSQYSTEDPFDDWLPDETAEV